MLGFLIHYSEGLRQLGFQLLGFYCKVFWVRGDLEYGYGRGLSAARGRLSSSCCSMPACVSSRCTEFHHAVALPHVVYDMCIGVYIEVGGPKDLNKKDLAY